MMKKVMIAVMVLLVLGGGALVAMDIPSVGIPDETDSMPALSGGMSDNELILVTVLVVLLVLLII